MPCLKEDICLFKLHLLACGSGGPMLWLCVSQSHRWVKGQVVVLSFLPPLWAPEVKFGLWGLAAGTVTTEPVSAASVLFLRQSPVEPMLPLILSAKIIGAGRYTGLFVWAWLLLISIVISGSIHFLANDKILFIIDKSSIVSLFIHPLMTICSDPIVWLLWVPQ